MHSPDDPARAFIQSQCQCRQQRRWNSKQNGGQKKHAQHVKKTRAHQIELTALKHRRNQAEYQKTEQTENPGERQHQACGFFVAPVICPPTPQPVTQRQSGEDNANDGRPTVYGYAHIRRYQATRGDLDNQQDRGTQKNRDAIPDNPVVRSIIRGRHSGLISISMTRPF